MIKLFKLALQNTDTQYIDMLMRLNLPLRTYEQVFATMLESGSADNIAQLVRRGFPESIYGDTRYISMAENSAIDTYEKMQILKKGVDAASSTSYADKFRFEILSKTKNIAKGIKEWGGELNNAKEDEALLPDVLHEYCSKKKQGEVQFDFVEQSGFTKKKNEIETNIKSIHDIFFGKK